MIEPWVPWRRKDGHGRCIVIGLAYHDLMQGYDRTEVVVYVSPATGRIYYTDYSTFREEWECLKASDQGD